MDDFHEIIRFRTKRNHGIKLGNNKLDAYLQEIMFKSDEIDTITFKGIL